MYYLVELQGGQLMTVYRDLLTGYWFEQRNSAPKDVPTPVDVFAERSVGRTEDLGLNRGALPPGSIRIGRLLGGDVRASHGSCGPHETV
jgi:hypothetical protein